MSKKLRQGKLVESKKKLREDEEKELDIEKVFDLHNEEDEEYKDEDELHEEDEEDKEKKLDEDEHGDDCDCKECMKEGEEDDEEKKLDEEDGEEVQKKLEEDEDEDEKKEPVTEDSDEEILKKLGEDEEKDELPKDVSENIKRMFEGENLTKEFKNRVTSIFEATVNAKAKSIRESYKKKALLIIKEQRVKSKERMVESLDRYMGHLAKVWFKENRISIVDGITLELSEGLMNSVKGLLSRYNVRVPRSKENLVEKLSGRVTELEEKLNKQMDTNIKLQESLGKVVKKQYIKSFAEGLSDTDKEKFVGLAEEVSFTDEKSYRTKLKSIKEGLFPGSKKTGAEDFASKMLVTEQGEEKKGSAPAPSEDIKRFVEILDNGVK